MSESWKDDARTPKEITVRAEPKYLKGKPRFCYGGGEKVVIFHSKYKISGLECRRRFKLVLAHTMDPSGPFWGAHPAEKYLHTRRHTLEKFAEKMHIFAHLGVHGKCPSMRHVQCIIYYIYYIYYWICWDSDIAAASGCPARGRAGQAGSGRPRPGPNPYKNQGFEAGGWRPSEALVAGSRTRPSRISFIIYHFYYIYYGIRWILLKSRYFAA